MNDDCGDTDPEIICIIDNCYTESRREQSKKRRKRSVDIASETSDGHKGAARHNGRAGTSAGVDAPASAHVPVPWTKPES